MNPKLSTFLATGEIPTTSKERNLLLDLARLELSQKYTNQTTTMLTYFRRNPKTGENVTLNGDKELAAFEASLKNEVTKADLKQRHFTASTPSGIEVEAAQIAALAAKARAIQVPASKAAKTLPVIHRAAAPTATATAKPTPAPEAPGLTTAAQFAGPPLVMKRDEFQKLSPADRSRFLKSGGKLA